MAEDKAGNKSMLARGDLVPRPHTRMRHDDRSRSQPAERHHRPAERHRRPAEHTTAPPSDTTAPPSDTTAPPSDTTTPPSDTTTPPSDTTTPPSDTTTPPSDTTTPPSTPPPDRTMTEMIEAHLGLRARREFLGGANLARSDVGSST